MAQSVEVSDFSSGPDLEVCEFEPHPHQAHSSELTAQSLEPASDSVSPSLSSPPSPQKMNKR